MRIINITVLLLVFCLSNALAQDKARSSDQKRTIEIDNENGELFISFKNGVIQEFTLNDTPVSKERYNEYQEIIDDFSNDGTQPLTPAPTPEPPVDDRDETAELFTAITEYLANETIINSKKKYKILLKREYLKVNGNKLPTEFHNVCLDFFEEIYGHKLNAKSEVKFKKSRKNYTSSIKIRE